MDYDPKTREFLDKNHSAAMVTLRRDGIPHVVRVGVALVDGKLQSSGTQTRLRTRHLRRHPRSTLFVSDPRYAYLGIESRVTILEGPDVPARIGDREDVLSTASVSCVERLLVATDAEAVRQVLRLASR